MQKLLLLSALGLLVSACSDGEGDGSGGSGTTSTASDATSSAGSPTGTTGSSPTTSGSSVSTGTGTMTGGCDSYAFCEDFEEGSPGETPPGWTEHAGWDQGGSRAVLSAEEKHGGAQSLKGAVGTNGQYRIAHALDALGPLASHHWGRIFYKVKTPVALDGQYVHNTFLAFGRPESSNGSESRVVDTVVDPSGNHQFLFNVPDDSCCAGSSYDYAYDSEWHCAEWYVDGAAQSFRFYYDGTEVTDIAFDGVEGAHIADFDSVIVGWINYQSPSTPNEGWFDDLAIDDERIGCGP
jgi:hypothetical protein